MNNTPVTMGENICHMAYYFSAKIFNCDKVTLSIKLLDRTYGYKIYPSILPFGMITIKNIVHIKCRLRSRVVSVRCSNALLCVLMVCPRLSCRLPCSQLGTKRWRSMHCRQACTYAITRSREVHMYGKTCDLRGRPQVVRLPKKPSALQGPLIQWLW